MQKVIALILVCCVFPVVAQGQSLDNRSENSRMLLESKYGILSTSITNLSLRGDSLWIGPYLNITVDGGDSWYVADTDSLYGTSNRTYSLDAGDNVVAAGLGRIDVSSGDVQTAAGFLISDDGGDTFEYTFPQLDQPADSTIEYGVSSLKALAIIVPQQSPPFDIDYSTSSREIWVAGWASGIRRSADMGRTWHRVVLPPDELDFVTPDSLYDFYVAPRRGGDGSFNHMGFSVLVDSQDRVWAGTAGGLNRSLDGGWTWQKFVSDGTGRSLAGNWIISIEEQVFEDDSIIWMANWPTGDGERFGVTFTADAGESFQQALQGERIYDFAFSGSTVYAAGENGLFVSYDGGSYWVSIREFRNATQPVNLIARDEPIFSVEAGGGVVWVGTGNGLLKSIDNGSSWNLYDVEVPLRPDTPDDRVPAVDTFAFPNPFSPAGDGTIRIRFDAESAGVFEIRIFDFGMNLVRTISFDTGAGLSDVRWDGMSDNGVRVANGPYFYEVRSGNRSFRGKILVVE